MRVGLFSIAMVLLTAAGASAAPGELAQSIDEHLAKGLSAAGMIAAPTVDDAAFLRRVSLDLIGRIPTPSEVQSFTADTDDQKRAAVVDRLIESPEHADHFARTWRALLLPESETNRELRYFVPGFEAWWRERRLQRAGFDDIVRELLTVPITGTQDRPQLVLKDLKAANPVAFIATKNADAAALASATTQLFLGIRLECAQCHNHPFDQWAQHQFWNQAAFFAGIERRGKGAFAPLLEVRDRRSIPVMATETIVPALFLDGSEPSFSDDLPPRVALAQWITSPENPFFARAVANRVWGELMGVGIVDPVGDMDGSNPPSHPELLQTLADAFTASDFDIGLLYRAICRSDAYQRTSRQTDASQADPRSFAHKVIKPMTGEQFFDSLAVAIARPQPAGDISRDEDRTRRQVVALFDAHGAPRDPETSVAQVLVLMNGGLISDAATPESSPWLQALLTDTTLSDADRIEQLYLATYCRTPTEAECGELLNFVNAGGQSERSRRLGDVLWMLLNSAEFRWNH
jgi:hypothetical protein